MEVRVRFDDEAMARSVTGHLVVRRARFAFERLRPQVRRVRLTISRDEVDDGLYRCVLHADRGRRRTVASAVGNTVYDAVGRAIARGRRRLSRAGSAAA